MNNESNNMNTNVQNVIPNPIPTGVAPSGNDGMVNNIQTPIANPTPVTGTPTISDMVNQSPVNQATPVEMNNPNPVPNIISTPPVSNIGTEAQPTVVPNIVEPQVAAPVTDNVSPQPIQVTETISNDINPSIAPVSNGMVNETSMITPASVNGGVSDMTNTGMNPVNEINAAPLNFDLPSGNVETSNAMNQPNNNQVVNQNANVITPVANEPVVNTSSNDSNVSDDHQVVGIGTYVGILILTMIPVIGIIVLIAKALDKKNKNVSNFAKAQLILMFIATLFVTVLTIILSSVAPNIITNIANAFSNEESVNYVEDDSNDYTDDDITYDNSYDNSNESSTDTSDNYTSE